MLFENNLRFGYKARKTKSFFSPKNNFKASHARFHPKRPTLSRWHKYPKTLRLGQKVSNISDPCRPEPQIHWVTHMKYRICFWIISSSLFSPSVLSAFHGWLSRTLLTLEPYMSFGSPGSVSTFKPAQIPWPSSKGHPDIVGTVLRGTQTNLITSQVSPLHLRNTPSVFGNVIFSPVSFKLISLLQRHCLSSLAGSSQK